MRAPKTESVRKVSSNKRTTLPDGWGNCYVKITEFDGKLVIEKLLNVNGDDTDLAGIGL